MGKIMVEICLISARGLRVGTGIGSSLLKHQWYAVGWIDPEDKYCTTIDASRSDNPIWRTKFSALLDEEIKDSKSALHIEVYSREPIFLRKKLHGSATVSLKEFLAKYKQSSSIEETGSYQLRKTSSSKSHGFVDVSIRLSSERDEGFGAFTGDIGGVMLSNNSDYNTSGQNYMAGSMQQPYYPPQPMQPPPYYPPPPMQPPPSNAGYVPAYIPRSDNAVNIASSSSGGGYGRPGQGFAARMGAGGIVGGGIVGAAAALYGGDYLSGGFDLPSLPNPSFSMPGGLELPSLPKPGVSISIDPPF